jgi:thiol-disulfide isomerase/thioredoxin
MRALRIALVVGTGLVLAGLVPSRPSAAEGKPADASAHATRRLAGRVLDADGKAVEGAEVCLFARDASDKPEMRRGMVKTGVDGAYRFENLAARAYVVAVLAPGFARAYRLVKLQDGDRSAIDMTLNQAGVLAILVRMPDGKPIAGARVLSVEEQDANGSFFFDTRRFEDARFNLDIPTSDHAGRVELPALPLRASVAFNVEHPDFVQAQLSGVTVKPQTQVDAVLRPGVRLTLRLEPAVVLRQIAPPTLRLDRVPFGRPSTYVDFPLAFDKDGVAKVTVLPGNYSLLTLQHKDYLIVPRITADAHHESFAITQGSNDAYRFDMKRKVIAQGRVVEDPSGKPVANEVVVGEVLGASAPNASGKTALQWVYADSKRTDAGGAYSLQLASGLARVTCYKDNFTSDPQWNEVSIKAPGPASVRKIRIHPTPKVSGRVVGPDGGPAAHTVVRFRGPQLRWENPTLTDSQGRFELQPSVIPTDENGKRVFAHPLVAFHAYEPLGARTEIHLDRPESLSDVTLKLKPEPYERQLDEVANEWRDWEAQGSKAGRAKGSIHGGLAPELDCRLWLNVPQGTRKLADFRGRYVLLDFWTTWCHFCHDDYPSVRLAYELYKDHGLTVIGVHDNSVDPDRIRKYVESSPMAVPIAIDQADGRTLTAYHRECGVNSFPSYVLIGPDGTIVNADKVLPGPLLRSFKIEIIRAHVMGDAARAGHP